MWKIWCKALGQKEGKNNREADAVAVIRTCILIGYMVTNCFIIAGVVDIGTLMNVYPLIQKVY